MKSIRGFPTCFGYFIFRKLLRGTSLCLLCKQRDSLKGKRRTRKRRVLNYVMEGNMKKSVKLLIAAAVSCTVIAGFSACEFENTEHTHTPDTVWHGNEVSHWHECIDDGEVIESSRADHTDKDDFVTDGTSHWRVCDECELVYGKEAHTPDNDWHTDGANRWHECTECGAEIESTKVENKKITLPEHSSSAVYTGNALACGLTSGEDYTVTYSADGEEVTPINAGVYGVTVSLTDKAFSKWSDGTTDDKTFTFEITAKEIAVPTSEKTAYKCNEGGVIDLIAETADYAVSGGKNTETGVVTVTVALKDKVNAVWADGTTEDKSFDFNVEHTYAWTTENGVATYGCIEHDGETKTLKLAVENRRDLVLGIDDDGKSSVAATLDLSSIGEYASVEKIVLGETVLSEGNTLAIPAGTAFALFGEQTMVVTVKTADGASHEITVPVLLITEEISDFERLVELVQIIDGKCGKFAEGYYYTLADDITLAEGTYYNAFGINGGNGLATAGAGNGFAGTLDGKGHSIIGGIMAGGGLFGSLQSATVKNIHFKDVQPYNNNTVSVITGSMFDSVLDNVTVTIKGAADFTGNAQGIVSSNRIINVTLNKVTVNAEECSYKSLFGAGWANPTAKIACTDVVVNVKSLQCIAVDSNNASAKPTLEIGEVEGITGRMNATVSPAEKLSLIKNDFTLTLGEKYADATEVKSALYGGNEVSVENWTIENGVLSGNSSVFGLTEVGSVSFVIAITSRGFDYTLTIDVVVESGYEKVTLENSADLVITNNGTDNTEIAVNLGETYTGYTITDAIVGTTKLTVTKGKIVVDDVLKGVKAGAQTLMVQANDGENYYEFTMPAFVVSESITSFDRLVELVQIKDAKCGKFNEGKYFILGDDITLAAGTEYNSQVKPDGTPAYGYAGAGSGNGFAGTLDGRGRSIIGGKIAAGGLFGSLQSATIKNISFTDVQAVNGAPISVITGSMYDSVIEKVTITVKGNVNVKGWNNGTESVGIIASNRVVNITLKNVTVNATGCSFETVFGKGYGNVAAKITCTDVVINVKALDYITTNSNNENTLAVGAVEDITVNLTQE